MFFSQPVVVPLGISIRPVRGMNRFPIQFLQIIPAMKKLRNFNRCISVRKAPLQRTVFYLGELAAEINNISLGKLSDVVTAFDPEKHGCSVPEIKRNVIVDMSIGKTFNRNPVSSLYNARAPDINVTPIRTFRTLIVYPIRQNIIQIIHMNNPVNPNFFYVGLQDNELKLRYLTDKY